MRKRCYRSFLGECFRLRTCCVFFCEANREICRKDWCVCKFFCDIRLFTYKHIFPAAISPVEGISPDEYILSFDCSIQFPPDTDNQARKSCWDTEHLRHPCCRTSADRQEHSRQRRRLWQRKRLLTSRKTVTQNLSWNFFLINVVQWVQSAISFIFVHLY